MTQNDIDDMKRDAALWRAMMTASAVDVSYDAAIRRLELRFKLPFPEMLADEAIWSLIGHLVSKR